GLISAGLLPLADIPIEVGKVLFLNNAINHGVLAPLGVAAAAQNGRAIHFLLETNPGPGLGLLLSFMFFGKGMAKLSAPGAIIIHFFGGIHETSFPSGLSRARSTAARRPSHRAAEHLPDNPNWSQHHDRAPGRGREAGGLRL